LIRLGTYVLRCPFFVSNDNSLNDFDTLQTSTTASVLKLCEYNLIKFIVRDEIMVLSMDTVFFSELLESCLDWDDDGYWPALCLISIDTEVKNDWV
jgi:hypothetical protein